MNNLLAGFVWWQFGISMTAVILVVIAVIAIIKLLKKNGYKNIKALTLATPDIWN